MRKYWILIHEILPTGLLDAYVVPVDSSSNIKAILDGCPNAYAVNICDTKRDAHTQAQTLRDRWRSMGCWRWDYMEDGTTPAPF